MAESIYVKGLADLQKFLDQLPAKVEKNIVRGALRAGMKEVLPVAQQNCAKASGLLAAGLKLSTSARGGRVTASIKARGPHGYLANWIEYGTAAHNIAAKKGGWLSFGGIFAKEVMHPGAKPHPFMRRALDSQAKSVVIVVANNMKAKLESKHGLDTADIVIEGDE